MNDIILPDSPGIVDRSSIRDDRRRRRREACRGDDHVPRHATRDSLGLHDSQEDQEAAEDRGERYPVPFTIVRPPLPLSIHPFLSRVFPWKMGAAVAHAFSRTLSRSSLHREDGEGLLPGSRVSRIASNWFPSPFQGREMEEGESGGSG